MEKIYNLGEKWLYVVSESPWMSDHIHCFLRPLEVNTEIPEGQPFFRLFILCSSELKSTMQMVCPELNSAASKTLGINAWRHFRQLFMEMTLSPNYPQYVLHASSVTNASGTKTASVCAFSNAGKTSVMLDLLTRGQHYLVDDYTCLSLDDHRIKSLPIGCTITDDTFTMIPELEPLRSDTCKFFLQDVWQWTIQPGDLFPVAASQSAYTPTHMFFMFPNFGGKSSMSACSRDEVLWWFQQGRVSSMRVMPTMNQKTLPLFVEGAKLARYVADNVRCYTVANGNVKDTSQMILEAVEKE